MSDGKNTIVRLPDGSEFYQEMIVATEWVEDERRDRTVMRAALGFSATSPADARKAAIAAVGRAGE